MFDLSPKYALKAFVRAALSLMIACAGAALCLAQETRNQSQAMVTVTLKNGGMIVDGTHSSFTPSPLFKEKSRTYKELRKHLAETEADKELKRQVEKALFDDLNKCFGMTTKVYWWLLTDAQRKLDQQGKLDDPLTELRNATTKDFSEFKEKLKNLLAKRGEEMIGQQQKAFQGITSQLVADPISLETKTALILDFNTDDVFATSPFDSNQGTINFRVADPVASSDYQVTLKDAGCGAGLIAKQSDIVQSLKPFEGGLWRSADIRSLLEEFYSDLGYQATVTLSRARDNPKTIDIQESPRITRIVFSCTGSDLCDNRTLMEEALYLLLPDDAFRSFVRLQKQKDANADTNLPFTDILGASGKPDFKVIVLGDLITKPTPGRCPEPYLNLLKLQGQQSELQQLDLTAATAISARGSDFVELQIQKATKSAAAGDKEPDNVAPSEPSAANRQISLNARQPAATQTMPATNSASVSQLPRSDVPRSTEENLARDRQRFPAAWQPKEKNNFAGVGFDYRPGQGVSAFALYRRSRLLSAQDSFSIQVGGHGGVLSTIDYATDFLFFNALHRRLSLRLTAASDVEASRILAGVKIDERRTGGSARVDFELFRDRGGSQLRFFAETERKTVELSKDTQSNQVPDKLNLTTLDLGALYFFQSGESRYPRTLRLEPRLRFGLGAAADEPSFKVISLKANWHQKLPKLYELDFTQQTGIATDRTPLFELPSLGGEDTVRGFRRDDAIGQTLWSLQNELWMPVPGLSRDGESLGNYIRRNVRLAGFVDIGGVYRTAFSQPGMRIGPGIGARIIRFPVVIKLDWAYGIGEGASGVGRGRFYFSLTTNLPF
ncbi:MAG: hypothetical protein DMF61_01815 [Blastocatellia bacterium AA13]|nr:MAG: hypothetical protein DMF61_01815 [Blastocatellia bacterium AA13]